MRTRVLCFVIDALILFLCIPAQAQNVYNQIDETGNASQRSDNQNFNKHSNDTTKAKEIPRGIYVWTVDRKFGDITKAEVDTMPHLFMNSTMNTGRHMDYNTTGNNYSPRLSRIFMDRDETEQFLFTQPYSQVIMPIERFHFTNTLSPLTNIIYDNCGDKTNGEDHIEAKFAVNANKRLGFGFDLNYAYARGYYNAQNNSHFGATLFTSYLGDKYNMHLLLSTYDQKEADNGGITNDEYVMHPESFQDSYSQSEIPTVLELNWNRNHHSHAFLTHRYNLGFYRKVKMTDDEIKARQFAKQSQQEKKGRDDKDKNGDNDSRKQKKTPESAPSGRPEGARIAGAEPPKQASGQHNDSTRITVDSKAVSDSLLRTKSVEDSLEATMKKEFVPVTSFIHTFELHNNSRIYQSYETPTGYYLNTYYAQGLRYSNDSIFDKTRNLQVKNTLAVGLLEGFNKYMKAGLKAFVTHDYRRYEMPDLLDDETSSFQNRWKENNFSVGGRLSKTQGSTLHFNLQAEAWVVGEDAGQMKADFSTDLNFPVLGDTVRLAAKAYLHRLNPTFYQRRYHSKHLWWDNDLSKETRTRIEGLFSYERTNTQLRVAIEEIQNYTYFGMSYDATTEGRTNLTASVYQNSGNINLLSAQLRQDFCLGPLKWENIITYQNSSNSDVLPLPQFNIFTNLYLKFLIAKVLTVELGADATYFTSYYAPDFCPQINQFAVQQNSDSRVKLGDYPIVDVYANMHLKHTRFFIMMTHVSNGMGNHKSFLAPHYPMNGQVLHVGLSWNFFN